MHVIKKQAKLILYFYLFITYVCIYLLFLLIKYLEKLAV